MGEPHGRTPVTLTDPEQPQHPEQEEYGEEAVRRRIRDLPPPSTDGPSLSDPEARRPAEDPLDAHKPGIERDDPLDPYGHAVRTAAADD